MNPQYVELVPTEQEFDNYLLTILDKSAIEEYKKDSSFYERLYNEFCDQHAIPKYECGQCGELHDSEDNAYVCCMLDHPTSDSFNTYDLYLHTNNYLEYTVNDHR